MNHNTFLVLELLAATDDMESLARYIEQCLVLNFNFDVESEYVE
jgi:UDP-N-acetylenolpyruvoylglucosamine reductase